MTQEASPNGECAIQRLRVPCGRSRLDFMVEKSRFGWSYHIPIMRIGQQDGRYLAIILLCPTIIFAMLNFEVIAYKSV